MSQLNANTTKPCKFQGVYKIWLGDQAAKRFWYHALVVEISILDVHNWCQDTISKDGIVLENHSREHFSMLLHQIDDLVYNVRVIRLLFLMVGYVIHI